MPAPPLSTDEGTHGGGHGRSRPRRPRWSKVLVGLAVSLVLLVGLVAAGGAFLLHRYESAFSRDTLIDPDARAAGDHRAIGGPLNFLLIGSDYRRWSPDAGQRSDTIIVAHVTGSLDHVYLVSVPRDLLVTIPPDPAHGFGGANTKINAAFDAGRGGAGGIQLLSRTLTNLIGVRFDGAVALQFDGLKHAVELLGGVSLCVDVRTVSIHTHKVFPVGCRLMNANDVLDYLRQRQFADGDFTRQRHQQQFIKALLQRAASTGVLTNPVRLDEFLRAVAGAMTVDSGEASMADLVFALRGIRAQDLTGVRIPTRLDMINNVSYVVATGDAGELFSALRRDTMSAWASRHKQWVNTI